MTVDEFKRLADKIAHKEATPEEKEAFIHELSGALRECRSTLVH